MPDATTSKETWSDWFPDDKPVYTIGEVVELTQDMGVEPITVATLRSWQKIGLLPLPRRRRRGSGTVALYPNVAPDVLKRIRQLQYAGLGLKEIAPLIRGQVRIWYKNDRLDLRAPIMEAARKHAEWTGLPVLQVQVTMTDVTSTDMTYTFFMPIDHE